MKAVSDDSLNRMLRAMGREALTSGECPEDQVSDERLEEILQNALGQIRELDADEPPCEVVTATGLTGDRWLLPATWSGLEGISENHLAGREPLSLDCEVCDLVYG